MQSVRFRLPAVLLLLAGAVSVSAGSQQSGPGAWWKSADVQKELGLTAEQVRRIDAIWETTRPEMMQDREDLEKFEAQLSKRISRKAPEAEVVMAIDRAESSRARLNKTRTLMLYRMQLVLTDEQNAKFRTMQERRQRQNAGRGGAAPSGSKPPSAPQRNGSDPDRRPQ